MVEPTRRDFLKIAGIVAANPAAALPRGKSAVGEVLSDNTLPTGVNSIIGALAHMSKIGRELFVPDNIGDALQMVFFKLDSQSESPEKVFRSCHKEMYHNAVHIDAFDKVLAGFRSPKIIEAMRNIAPIAKEYTERRGKLLRPIITQWRVKGEKANALRKKVLAYDDFRLGQMDMETLCMDLGDKLPGDFSGRAANDIASVNSKLEALTHQMALIEEKIGCDLASGHFGIDHWNIPLGLNRSAALKNMPLPTIPDLLLEDKTLREKLSDMYMEAASSLLKHLPPDDHAKALRDLKEGLDNQFKEGLLKEEHKRKQREKEEENEKRWELQDKLGLDNESLSFSSTIVKGLPVAHSVVITHDSNDPEVLKSVLANIKAHLAEHHAANELACCEAQSLDTPVSEGSLLKRFARPRIIIENPPADLREVLEELARDTKRLKPDQFRSI